MPRERVIEDFGRKCALVQSMLYAFFGEGWWGGNGSRVRVHARLEGTLERHHEHDAGPNDGGAIERSAFFFSTAPYTSRRHARRAPCEFSYRRATLMREADCRIRIHARDSCPLCRVDG